MRFASLIALVFIFVGCQRATDTPIITPHVPEVNTTIAMLRRDIVGVGGVDIWDNIVVGGRVVSADSEGNYYGSIVVEDGSGAVEVMLGMANLESIYPVGLYVALRIYGCYADYVRGVLQIGVKQPQYEYYGVGYLSSREECDRVVVRSTDVDVVEPMTTRISEFSETMCGRLVRVRGVKLMDSSSVDTLAGDVLESAVWRGYSLFKDAQGDSVALYTSSYAQYSNMRIPQDSVTIVGVLQRDSYRGGAECYYLKMRYATDCTIH